MFYFVPPKDTKFNQIESMRKYFDLRKIKKSSLKFQKRSKKNASEGKKKRKSRNIPLSKEGLASFKLFGCTVCQINCHLFFVAGGGNNSNFKEHIFF